MRRALANPDLDFRRSGGEAADPGILLARAVQEGTTQTGAILGLVTRAAGLRKLSVNSTPLVGEDGACRGTLATFVSAYATVEALQKVLDMGVVEGASSAINQIDDLVAA